MCASQSRWDTHGRMSEENVVVVRGMWEAFLRNDFEASLGAIDPDLGEAGKVNGHE